MRVKNNKEIVALYRGERFIDVGEREKIRKKYRFNERNFDWLLTPSAHKRWNKVGCKRLLAFRVKEDDDKGEVVVKKNKKHRKQLFWIVRGLEKEFGTEWYKNQDYVGSEWDNLRKMWLSIHADGNDTVPGKKRWKYVVVEPSGKRFECYGVRALNKRYGCDLGYDKCVEWFTERNCYFHREKYDRYSLKEV